jgi:hypothetical protein
MNMAGDLRDFPAEVEPENLKKAAIAFDNLMGAIMDDAVGEYFLQQAEKPLEDDGTASEFLMLCPGMTFKALGVFIDLAEAENFLETHHFENGSASGGDLCDNQVDYDMHFIVKLDRI